MPRPHADDERPETPESALHRDDEQRTLDHKLDRMAPSRRAVWPKDDRRSSDRVHRNDGEQPRRRQDDLPAGELPLQ